MRPFFSPFENDKTDDYASVWLAHPGWLAIAIQARDMATWCGIPEISSQTMERWLRLWALAYALDSLLDDHPPALRQEAGQIFEQVLTTPDAANELPEWVDPNVVPLVGLLRSAMSELGPTAWDDCVTAALKIRDIGRLKADAYRLRHYLRLVKSEAKWTARLVFVCMNTEERRRRIRYHRFTRAFAHLTLGGILYDHARDLDGDYEKGLTSVKPSKRKALLLLLRGVLEAAKFLFHPRVTTMLFRVRLYPPRLQLMAYWIETEQDMRATRAEALGM